MFISSLEITKATVDAGTKSKYRKIEFSPKGVYLNNGERACAKLFVRQEGSEIFSTPYFCFPGQPYVATKDNSLKTNKSVELNGTVMNFQGAKQLFAGFALYNADNYHSYAQPLIDKGRRGEDGSVIYDPVYHEPWIDWTELAKDGFVWADKQVRAGSNPSFSRVVNFDEIPSNSYGAYYYSACAGTQKDPDNVSCGAIVEGGGNGLDLIKIKTLSPQFITNKDAFGNIIETQFIPKGRVEDGGLAKQIYTFFYLLYPNAKSSEWNSGDIYSITQSKLSTNAGIGFDFETDSPISLTSEILRNEICYMACASVTDVGGDYTLGVTCDSENKQCFKNSGYINPDVENKFIDFAPANKVKGFSLSGIVNNRSKFGRLYAGYKYYSANDPTNIITVFDTFGLQLNPQDNERIIFARYDSLIEKAKAGYLFATFCVRESDAQEPICAPNWVSGTFDKVPDVVSFDRKKLLNKVAGDVNIALFGRIKNINEYPSVKGGFRLIPDGGSVNQATYFWTPTYLSGGSNSFIDFSVSFKLSGVRNKSSNGIYHYSACAQDQTLKIFCNEGEKYLIDSSKADPSDGSKRPVIKTNEKFSFAGKQFSTFANTIFLSSDVSNLDNYPNVNGGFALWDPNFSSRASAEYVWDKALLPTLGSDSEMVSMSVEFDKLRTKPVSRKLGYTACAKDQVDRIFCDDINYVMDLEPFYQSGCTVKPRGLFIPDSTPPAKSENDDKVLYYEYPGSGSEIRLHYSINCMPENGPIFLGFNDCRGFKGFKIKADSCQGNELTSCDLEDTATCVVDFKVKRTKESQKLFWCMDRNSDGKFDGKDESGEFITLKFVEVSEDFDWRNKEGKNWMTPVRDQGQLGSCISFSTCAAMEAKYRIEQSKPEAAIDLSEMWLHTKLEEYIKSGNGIVLWKTFKDSIKRQGIPDDVIFPYTDIDEKIPDTRNYNEKGTTALNISLENNLQTAQMIKTLKYGPFNVSIHMNDHTPSDSTAIKNGFLECAKGRPSNHAVVVVGYKVTKGDENSPEEGYWITKNSWGISSGDNGYIKIKFNDCEINNEIIELSGVKRPYE
jgi:C1A family cysteine protease